MMKRRHGIGDNALMASMLIQQAERTAKLIYGDKAGIVGVRAMYSLDVLVLHPASFTVISSIT